MLIFNMTARAESATLGAVGVNWVGIWVADLIGCSPAVVDRRRRTADNCGGAISLMLLRTEYLANAGAPTVWRWNLTI